MYEALRGGAFLNESIVALSAAFKHNNIKDREIITRKQFSLESQTKTP